jgi:hypothetical protein
MALVLVLCAASTRAATIDYDGKGYWINGVNVPWHWFGNDIGGGYDAAWFETFFSECETNGVNCVRLWIHCDGWASPEFDGSGYVTGLDATFLSDFDDVFDRAENHNVMVMPCLWSFDMTGNANGIGLIADVAKTQSYIDNALIPVVQHLANTPNLFAWEISNEPEWSVVDGAHVTQAELQRFCAMIAAAIHDNCGKMVTVGSASLKWNSDVPPAEANWWSDAALQAQHGSSSAYLDFYQIHYYDWMVGDGWAYDPYDLGRPVSYWQLDKPVLIGETPAATDGIYSMAEQINNSFANGYVGIMFWSYNSDWSGNWGALTVELKSFRDAHPDIVDYDPSGSGNPAPTVSITQPASGAVFTAPADVTVTADASDIDGGYVVKVEFFAGASPLGEDTAAPYSVTWSDVPAGSYTLTAKATDDGGATRVSAGVGITVNEPRGPFGGVARAIPGRVEAEDYDAGGEAVAYHDTTPGNVGGQYRSDDVDIEVCSEGGFNVAYVVTGEWLEYTVDVAQAGTYDVSLRVASDSAGGTLHVEFDGVDETGQVTFAATGGWQAWTTVTATGVTLATGEQVVRVFAETDGFNLDWLEVSGADSDGDGLPDDWEMTHFGDLDETPDADPDGDGYTNAEEFAAGTDPADPMSIPADGGTTTSGCASARPGGGAFPAALAAALGALVALARPAASTRRGRRQPPGIPQ